MQCDYFDAALCRSCSWMGRAYPTQVADVARLAHQWLPMIPPDLWEPVAVGPQIGFRNKAKMVVAGSPNRPTLGIVRPDGGGVDLRACGIHDPRITAVLPTLAEFVVRAELTPYEIATRRGELKHVHVTVAPDGALMVRWILRSTEPVLRLRKHLPTLQRSLPTLQVASANIQPRHAAIQEGPEEHLLTATRALTLELPTVTRALTLRLRPGGFCQTNHHVAAQLYDTAADWLRAPMVRPGLWDLYCGVGGFALALAEPEEHREARTVVGVESSSEAVLAAQEAAGASGVRAEFVAADAGAYAAASPPERHPGTVVVNPPRRGIGDLTTWLEASRVQRVLYSSCHLGSLAEDLRRLPSWRITRARVFDMFPQTAHVETAVLLERHAG